MNTKAQKIYLITIILLIISLAVTTSARATSTAVIALSPLSETIEETLSEIEQQSLMNCKQLVKNVFDILLIQLECNTLDDLKVALSTELFPIDAISSSTIWIRPPKE